MRRTATMAALLVFAACAGPAQADSPLPMHGQLVNGDFTSGSDSGWSVSRQDLAGYTDIKSLANGGVRIRKVMCGYARIAQRVALADHRQSFSTRLLLKARANNPGYHAYAALVLTWLDGDGKPLGETRYYSSSGRYSPRQDETHHSVGLPAAGNWQDLELDIAAELRGNLPGIRPASVRGLEIVFESFASGRSSC